MEFKKYQHIERYGTTDETDGIESGRCYIFPKIDGTNSQVYLRDGIVRAGSRPRELTLEKDNENFYCNILRNENIAKFLNDYPQYRLYGEYLTKHIIRTYNQNAWRKFYVFDVCEDADNPSGVRYLTYEEYAPLLEKYNINYIPCIGIVENGTLDDFAAYLDKNTYLIRDGAGVGEGIIIKNYEFHNKYGRQTWAKIVTSEFKSKKVTGLTDAEKAGTEERIIFDYCTEAFILKEYDKIVGTLGREAERSDIPKILGTIYKTLIQEEMWHIVRKYKNPTIDFARLQGMVTNEIKAVIPNLFDKT